MLLIEQIDKLEDYVPSSLDARNGKHQIIGENKAREFMHAIGVWFRDGITRKDMDTILASEEQWRDLIAATIQKEYFLGRRLPD